jgi:hypothetical protein
MSGATVSPAQRARTTANNHQKGHTMYVSLKIKAQSMKQLRDYIEQVIDVANNGGGRLREITTNEDGTESYIFAEMEA